MRTSARGSVNISACRLQRSLVVPLRSGFRSRSAVSIWNNKALEKSAISGTGGQTEEPPVTRSAAMHDFCMVIPFGMILLIGGLVYAALKGGITSLAVSLVGGIELLLSQASLNAWRRGHSGLRVVILETILAGLMTCVGYKSPYNFWSASLLALSSAMVLFLVYNIYAGGNPRKQLKEKK